jgi:hypothetical protein
MGDRRQGRPVSFFNPIDIVRFFGRAWLSPLGLAIRAATKGHVFIFFAPVLFATENDFTLQLCGAVTRHLLLPPRRCASRLSQMVSEVALQRPANSALARPMVARKPSVPYQALNPALAQCDRDTPSAFLLTLAVEAHPLRAGRSIRLPCCGRRRLYCHCILSHCGSDSKAASSPR